ncbi:MAG TPA: DNA cytosine methyltransferase [Amaricoccus sp.]|uniref:DNA cytosine methyltransferase n=1 Tax=Amaricoccus sp. TaxID=1872485 RepID=UPI002CD59E8F|nr:DNA cytosine methyltransferase [Amaricoccus sp.]HMR51238.1 DNA cytosine methyltransferase [Amaricoccus sp.]HMT98012.1 DNA cytosine methyltransferase [Amaricoccus sp.]
MLDALPDLIIDSVAGGGGASTGIEIALGRSPDFAINHSAEALAMHRRNHPGTIHLQSDIWHVDPMTVAPGRPIGLLWASPDCKHFSKAKGGAVKDRNVRDLAWVVVDWAEKRRPSTILLENVEEFRTWGPVGEDGQPVRAFAGITFEVWCKRLRAAGYRIGFAELRACDYGAPTIRKRLFMIAQLRGNGRRIVWPKPTHGDPESEAVRRGRLLPWRTAADCIDWSIPCPSIFDSSEAIMARHGVRAKRPLAEATLRRIARGVMRYVVENPRPFVVPVVHAGDTRTHDSLDPLPTITSGGGGRGEHALVTPFLSLAQQGGSSRAADRPMHTLCASPKDQNALVAPVLVPRYGERPGQAPRCLPIDQPGPVVVPTGNGAALVAAFLAQHNGGDQNEGYTGRAADAPLSTLTARGTQQQVVAAHLANLHGSNVSGADAGQPLRTIAAEGTHAGVVAAFLAAYYGTEQDTPLDEPMHTDTTKPRFGLVTVEIDGQTYAIVDIGMRMLTPRERFRAQGFPEGYAIEVGLGADGEDVPLTKDAQGRCCGNSVCPPIAAALVAANCPDMVAEAAHHAAE